MNYCKSFFLLMFLLLGLNLQAQDVPKLTDSSLTTFFKVFEKMQDPAVAKIGSFDKTTPLQQVYDSFITDKELQGIAIKAGLPSSSLKEIFVILINYPVLLTENDWKTIERETGTSFTTLDQKMKYFASVEENGKKAFNKEDLAAIRETLLYFDRIKNWTGSENIAFLLQNQTKIQRYFAN